MNTVATIPKGIMSAMLVAALMGCHSHNQNQDIEEIPRTPGFSLPEEATLEYRRCTRDEECVYVTNGCCRCLSSRADLAVNRDRVEDFKRHLNCPSMACRMIGRNPPCGIGRISCDDGLCVYHMPPPTPNIKRPADPGDGDGGI